MQKEYLRLFNVSASVNEKQLLRCLSFSVYEGEVFGLICLNSAQKDALLDLLNDQISMDKGNIFWMDTLLSNPNSFKNLQISFIHSDTARINEASLSEYIFVFHRKKLRILDVIPRRLIRSQTLELLKELHLDVNPDAAIGTLSECQQMILDIFRAQLYGAKLIVVDRLPADMTANESELLLQVFDQLKAKKISILLLDSRVKLMHMLTDRMSILDHGVVNGFRHNDQWITSYMRLLDMPHDTGKNKLQPPEVIFESSENAAYDTIKIYRGEFVQLYDTGFGLNHRFIDDLHSTHMTYKSSYIDFKHTDLLVQTLTPLENLCLGCEHKISKGGFIDPRSMKFLQCEFNTWYGDETILEKTSVRELSLQEMIAIILFRLVISNTHILFCLDPRLYLDFKTYSYLISTIRKMTSRNMISVCVLSSEFDDGESLYDRRIHLKPKL